MEIKGREKTQKLTFEEISALNERKRELKDEHAAYIGEHPELKNILSDFMAAVLLEKPDDTFAFAKEHFAIGLPKKEHAKKKESKAPRPLVIGGPPGVGKGTLISMLLKAYPKAFGFSVSHTTREPKPGEEEGEAYFFTSKESMQADIDAGKFVEFSIQHGHFWGTSHESVERVAAANRICVLDIDLQGVRKVRRSELKTPLYIFVRPPSMEALEERLRARDTDDEDTITKKLRAAEDELEYAAVEGNFDAVFVNDQLEDAYEQMLEYLKGQYAI
jgi:guanylate kinase